MQIAAQRFKSVLIVTYGRTGSTLLQGILNTIPGYLIRGEIRNFPYALYMGQKNILDAKSFANKPNTIGENSTKPTHPFFGVERLNIEDYQKDCANLLENQLVFGEEKLRVFGFKEVKYIDILGDLDAYLNFLTKILPDVGFVFLDRKLEDVIHSSWWGKLKPEVVTEKISKYREIVKSYGEKSKENCFFLNYEDLISNGEELARLFEFLGEEYLHDNVAQCLSVRHSY